MLVTANMYGQFLTAVAMAQPIFPTILKAAKQEMWSPSYPVHDISNRPNSKNPSPIYVAGWWFQTFYFPFHIWDFIRNPLTNSIIFQRGRAQPPTRWSRFLFWLFDAAGIFGRHEIQCRCWWRKSPIYWRCCIPRKCSRTCTCRRATEMHTYELRIAVGTWCLCGIWNNGEKLKIP